MPERTTGMLLGKFLPPHLGHAYLVDFARNFCDELTVLVCSIEREPIPGALRFDWMRRMFPDCRVVHVDDELPQEPSESEEFWPLWKDAIRERLREGPTYVFASEPYGARLASELGAEFIPVDVERELVPVSGTKIREEPHRYWSYLPAEVRSYFLKRVCVFGPESTGKTTLAADLARRFDTVWVHEYARPYVDLRGPDLTLHDIENIARGQAAARQALERRAHGVIFSDTDALTTALWSETFFGEVPDLVWEVAASQQFDLYLLCDADVPFVSDAQRHFPEPAERQAFMARCEDMLVERGIAFVKLSGGWDERLRRATDAVSKLMGTTHAL